MKQGNDAKRVVIEKVDSKKKPSSWEQGLKTQGWGQKTPAWIG